MILDQNTVLTNCHNNLSKTKFQCELVLFTYNRYPFSTQVVSAFRACWRFVTSDIHERAPRIKTPPSASPGVCFHRLHKKWKKNDQVVQVGTVVFFRTAHFGGKSNCLPFYIKDWRSALCWILQRPWSLGTRSWNQPHKWALGGSEGRNKWLHCTIHKPLFRVKFVSLLSLTWAGTIATMCGDSSCFCSTTTPPSALLFFPFSVTTLGGTLGTHMSVELWALDVREEEEMDTISWGSMGWDDSTVSSLTSSRTVGCSESSTSIANPSGENAGVTETGGRTLSTVESTQTSGSGLPRSWSEEQPLDRRR